MRSETKKISGEVAREGPPKEEYLDADYIDEGTEFMRQNAWDDFSEEKRSRETSPKEKEGRRS